MLYLSSRRIRVWRGWVTGFLCIALLLSACTDSSQPSAQKKSSTDTSGKVTADGMEVGDGIITIRGGPSVAPKGTAVTLEAASVPELKDAPGVVLAAPAFDVSLAGGLQPKTPVTVEIDLAATTQPHGDTLIFMTQNSQTEEWEGAIPTVKGDVATVRMTHFSRGYFAWAGDFKKEIDEAIDSYLKLRFAAPSCVGKRPTIDGRKYNLKMSGNGLHGCVVDEKGSPTLTLHSNSPFLWSIKVPKGGTGRAGVPPVGLAEIATLATFNATVDWRYDRKTAVVPGGSASVRIDDLPAKGLKVQADAEPLLGFVAILWAALGGKFLKAMNVKERADAAECVADIVGSATTSDQSQAAGVGLNAIVSCLTKVAEAAGKHAVGFVLEVVSTMGSLFVAHVVGSVGELTGTNHITATVTATEVQTTRGSDASPAPWPMLTEADGLKAGTNGMEGRAEPWTFLECYEWYGTVGPDWQGAPETESLGLWFWPRWCKALLPPELQEKNAYKNGSKGPETYFMNVEPWRSGFVVASREASSEKCYPKGTSHPGAYDCGGPQGALRHCFANTGKTAVRCMVLTGPNHEWVERFGVDFQGGTSSAPGVAPPFWLRLKNGAECASGNFGSAPAGPPGFDSYVGICVGGPYGPDGKLWRLKDGSAVSATFGLVPTGVPGQYAAAVEETDGVVTMVRVTFAHR